MILSRVFLFPYWLALRVRNALYDSGRLTSMRHDVPVISVGNVTAGGTGKTPMVELLMRLLQDRCRVAVLSRGYKRRGKGFHLVEVDDTAAFVGDEPLQVKRKFPDVLVAVDKDRNHGVKQLMALPEAQRPEMILLDDGFQYRRLHPSLNLLLVDYNHPIFRDNLLPLGHLRDLPEQVRRADAVVFTKSPLVLDAEERTQMRELTQLGPDVPVFFATVRYCPPQPVFPEGDSHYIYSKEVFLFSGVADDTPMRVYLTDHYASIDHKRYGDHHRFSRCDQRVLCRYARRHPLALLLTTEKDAMRLLHCRHLDASVRSRLFYLPIETTFLTPEESADFENFICRREKNA
jgi:tetraacyldisaccharide 4'-kinase